MDEIANGYDEPGCRKFLLEMATGTGKTLLCAALIRRFLADPQRRARTLHRGPHRTRQTDNGGFNVVLGEYKPVIYKTARRTGELLGSSVVVATIQSLMTDRRYREEFTPVLFRSCHQRRGAPLDLRRRARGRAVLPGYAHRPHCHAQGVFEERQPRSACDGRPQGA